MRVSPGAIWRLVYKERAVYPGMYARAKHVHRVSERVKDRNKAFSDAAKKCAGLGLKEFNVCIADALEGETAPGTDAPEYTYAKAHKFYTPPAMVPAKPRARPT